MPPRYAYWTILIDGKATAFRAREREELLPTFNQLARKNPDAVMKYFSHGKLWDTPEQARWAHTNARPPREKRGPDWRPGGTHKDPRARFDKRKRQDRPPGRPPADRESDREGKSFERPTTPPPHRSPDRRFKKPSSDRRFEKPSPERRFEKPAPERRFEKPASERRFEKPAPRSFDRPSGQPPDRPAAKKPFERPWRKPSDRPWKKPSDRPSGDRPESARRSFDKPGGSREGTGPGGSGSRPFGKPPRRPSRPRGDFKKRR